MRNTFRIMFFEFRNTVLRPAFLLATFGLPLAPFLFFALINFVQPEYGPSTTEEILDAVSELSGEPVHTEAEGYVDASGVIHEIPASISRGFLIPYPNEDAALQALQDGEISAVYLVPADYLDSGKLFYVDTEFNPLWVFTKGKLFRWVLQVNLLGGDASLANQIIDPFDLQVKVLEPGSARDISDPIVFMQPYLVMMLFYMIMLTSSGLFLSSLKKEKENRVMEILLVTIAPKQLIGGKIFGLGAAGLIQTSIWIGIAYGAQKMSSTIYTIPVEMQLSPAIIAWGIIFYLLGYLLYASVLAGLGALVPDLRESSQFTIIILIPLLVPTMLMMFFIRDPNGALPTALSLFPPTASIAMMARLAGSNEVPLWQPALASGLIAANILLVMAFVSRLLQAQNLLSGQGFNIKRLIKSLSNR